MKFHSHHHLHQRKRVHQKLEPYPHPNHKMRFLDNVILVIAIIGPLTTLPQIWEIFYKKNVSGLSLLMWVLWTAFSFLWLVYGSLHREKPIIISSLLWIIFEIVIIWGIVMYG